MPEIKPDMAEWSRCISVHWSLPVQCVLLCTHTENWHEAWHPETGNRLRYRRSMGVHTTEELRHDAWHDLEIPPPTDATHDAIRSALDSISNQDVTGAVETLTDLLESLGGAR